MQLQNHFKLPFYMLFLILPMRHMSWTYKCSLIGLSKKLLHGERVIHTKKCLLPCPNKFYNYLGVSATLVWKGIVMFAHISKYISYMYNRMLDQVILILIDFVFIILLQFKLAIKRECQSKCTNFYNLLWIVCSCSFVVFINYTL